MALSYQLTIDCRNPGRLVRFWSLALGYVPSPAPDGLATWNDWYLSVGVPPEELDLTGDGQDGLMNPDGGGAPIWIQAVPERKTVKNRLHLDLKVGFENGRKLPYAQRRPMVEKKVAELVEAGGTVLRTNDEPEWERFTFTMGDPDGNEFCLI